MENKEVGFVRIASAIPVVEIANPKVNADRIISLIEKAAQENVKIVCFPELHRYYVDLFMGVSPIALDYRVAETFKIAAGFLLASFSCFASFVFHSYSNVTTVTPEPP